MNPKGNTKLTAGALISLPPLKAKKIQSDREIIKITAETEFDHTASGPGSGPAMTK